MSGIQVKGADFYVEKINGVPRIHKDGKAITPRIFAGNILYGGGRKRIIKPGCREQVRYAADTGIVIVSPEVRPFYVDVPKSREYLLEACRKVLELDPRIYLLPRISFTNDMCDMPSWALENGMLNSMEGDVAIVDNGQRHPSVTNPRFRAAMVKAMADTIEVLEKNYGDRIAGYQIGGLKVAEWQYLNFENIFSGYDIGTRNAFRAFLKKKYRTEAELAKAWGTPSITFDTVVVPTNKERIGKIGCAFREPVSSQKMIDFDFFRNQDIADVIGEIAQVIRKKCGKTRLICAFYGYVFECSATATGPATVGHLALRSLLDNPDIDLLAGPFSYMLQAREPGGSSVVHTTGESITEAGKIWINEDDYGTLIAKEQKNSNTSERFVQTWEDVYIKYRSHLAVVYARNYGIWYYDHHGTSWYDYEPLWKEIARMAKVEEQIVPNPCPYQPEVALLLDEDSFKYANSTRETRHIFRGITYNVRDLVSRASVSWGGYLLADVLRGGVDSKLDIHAFTLALDGVKRKALQERAMRIGSIWCWAPGYINLDDGRFSLKAMQELTGFRFKELPALKSLAVKSTISAQKLIPAIPECYGEGRAVSSFTVVPQKNDLVLACYMENNLPAVVFRPGTEKYAPALYCGTNTLPQALIRFMAQQSGVHVFCPRDLHINSNADLLCVTAPADGEYLINSGKSGVWTDRLTGKHYENGLKLKLQLLRGDTLYLEQVSK